jgi:hypothetical protein
MDELRTATQSMADALLSIVGCLTPKELRAPAEPGSDVQRDLRAQASIVDEWGEETLFQVHTLASLQLFFARECIEDAVNLHRKHRSSVFSYIVLARAAIEGCAGVLSLGPDPVDRAKAHPGHE